MKNTRLGGVLMGCLTLTPAVWGAAAVVAEPTSCPSYYEGLLDTPALEQSAENFLLAVEREDIDALKKFLQDQALCNAPLNVPEAPRVPVLKVIISIAVKKGPADAISNVVNTILETPGFSSLSPDGTPVGRYFADLFFAAIQHGNLPLLKRLLPDVTPGEMDYALLMMRPKTWSTEVRECFTAEKKRRKAEAEATRRATEAEDKK